MAEPAPAKWRYRKTLLVGFAIGAALGLVMIATGSASLAGDNQAQQGGSVIGYPIGTGLAGALIAGALTLIRNLAAK